MNEHDDFLLQFFKYDHLPPGMQAISKAFAVLANDLQKVLKNNPEKSACFRKLLEAKDCAVRSEIAKV